ncbi:metallophosphoesterase [bacterium]|nr:metallophosphoesterase [bacterium]
MNINQISYNHYQTNNRLNNKSHQPNFKSAIFACAAISDSHGDTKNLAKAELALNDNYKKIFNNSNPLNPSESVKPSSVYTAFMHSGDLLMNGAVKGYRDKTKCSADYQMDAMEKFTDLFGKRIKDSLGEEVSYKKYLALGNHDFDGTDKLLWDKVKNSNFTTVVSNIDLEKSPKVKELMEENDNIVMKEIISIPDDKNDERVKNGEEELFHKLLILGVTIPSIPFYNPTLHPDTHFLGETDKKDVKLSQKDLQPTLDSIAKNVKSFKEENPNGAVIVMSHTGNQISNMIRNAAPEVNFIFNGHDHENLVRNIGNTTIQSLGQNNGQIKMFKLFFDDFSKDKNGNITGGGLKVIDKSSTYTEKYDKDTRLSETEMQEWTNANLAKDDDAENYPAMFYNCPDPKYADYKTLKYNEHRVRSLNSPLANFLTTSIAGEVRRLDDLYGDDVASVAVQSSVIRSGIHEKMSNMDVIRIFNGLGESLSTLAVGEVTGDELAGIIEENIYSNLESDRNTMLQWSDVQINKDMLKDIRDGVSSNKAIDAIKMRDLKNEKANQPSTWLPVEADKKYKIVLPSKYLMKDSLKYVPIIKDRFHVVEDENYRTMSQLLNSANERNGAMTFTPKVAEERVIFHEIKDED